ncbi:hypothetical protein KEJ18_04210 [Candidatus Bathyarchaeota archaeon]|nr:hypothetical protein [Candidatus Bathyarchaeota archaeon]
MLLTLGLTTRSCWILTNTFGIGFLTPQQTVAAWFIELFAYILLANIEELHLAKQYKKDFENYRNKTAFLIPFIKTERKTIEVTVSIIVPAMVFWAVLQFHP